MKKSLLIFSLFFCSYINTQAQDGYYVDLVKASANKPDKLLSLNSVLAEAEKSEDADTLRSVRRAWKVLAIELGEIRYYKPAYIALDHYLKLKEQAHHNDKDQVVEDETDRLQNQLAEAQEEEDGFMNKSSNLEMTVTARKSSENKFWLIASLITLAFLLSGIIFLIMSLKRAYAYRGEAASLRLQLGENILYAVIGKKSGQLKRSIKKGVEEMRNLPSWVQTNEPVLEEQLTGNSILNLQDLVRKSETIAADIQIEEINFSDQE